MKRENIFRLFDIFDEMIRVSAAEALGQELERWKTCKFKIVDYCLDFGRRLSRKTSTLIFPQFVDITLLVRFVCGVESF